MAWVKAGPTSGLAPGRSKTIYAEGREVGVYNVKGEFFAIDNICPHAGGPLADGQIEGEAVYCPYHMWSFNIKTGEATFNESICVQSYPCKVEEEFVLIDI